MPTFRTLPGFAREFDNLSPGQQKAFGLAVRHLVEDLRKGQFRKGLRVKKRQGHRDVWEMTWAPDGRATFEYGEPVQEGEPHIIWRQIGPHEIFERP